MIVVCNSCSTRMQLDDAKIPPRTFTVKCPKCSSVVNVDPKPAVDPSALGIGQNPGSEAVKFKVPSPAPLYKSSTQGKGVEAAAGPAKSIVDPSDLAALLVQLLQKGVHESSGTKGRFNWERKRVLVCMTPQSGEQAASTLSDNDYNVYLAANTSQAIDRMREERMEVVLLEESFDESEQGFAFISNEINSLRPADRRRLIFGQMSPTVRTGDTHAAFVNNVNLVINPADIKKLPQFLERTMRDLNELYKDFNMAMSLSGF